MKGKTTCPKCNHEFVLDVPDEQEITTINCPNCTHSFTIKRVCHEEPDDECGWEEYGEPRKTVLSSIINKTNKPVIASFLLLTVGVLGIFFTVILSSSEELRIPELVSIASYFSGIDSLILWVAIGIASFFALAGSVMAFRRRGFIITFICAIIGIFSIGFFIGLILAVIVVILLVLSRDEFENVAKGKIF